MISERKLATFHNSYRKEPTGCWLWTKSLQTNGYGKFAIAANKHALAHRLSYLIYHGDLPTGLDVCHRCDVRACVNPDHLFLGSRQENIEDASVKGRLRGGGRRGEDHHAAKLSERDIPEIIRAIRSGMSKEQCARQYGVSGCLIGFIVRGQAWKHVPREIA